MKATLRPVKKSFPVNALIEGRRVLVVGGGRVGQRKVELLLEADADVTLVCPAAVAELEKLVAQGRVRHLIRRFEDGDVAGCVLVFACTDDKHVNRRVLEASRAARVPCCCADGNWPDSDFVTPAIIRSGDVLIAVSTSGRSCRHARLIKDNFGRHLDAISGSDLLALGTSHALLGAAERAPYHLLLQEREGIGDMLRQVWGVHEFFILNTCNRIEVVAAISREAGTCGILRRLMGFDRLRPDLCYMLRGFDAFAHLCRVTAGMESQTPGEFHVVAQIKDAVDEAVARGWAGAVMRELCDAALRVSKEIRREVEPLLEVVEIEEVALRYAEQELVGGLAGRTALVLGAGLVGQGLAKGLTARGGRCLWVYRRAQPDTTGLPMDLVEVMPLDRLGEALSRSDAVFCAISASEAALRVGEHGERLKPSGVLLVDLSMPRAVDPAFDNLGGAHRVADLDTLKKWTRAASGALDEADSRCARVMDAHRGDYARIRDSIQGELQTNQASNLVEET